MNRQLRRARQRGLTLVEILVAVVVGLVLTAGAVQIFISSKQAYRTTEALSRIQENGRYALNFLAKDLRRSDFFGCVDQAATRNNISAGAPFDFNDPPVEGTEGGGAPDSITLRMASNANNAAVAQQMPNTAANLFLTNSAGIQDGDILIVSDCEAADIFMVTNNNTNNNNLQHNSGVSINGISNSTQTFSRSYGTSARVFAASERTYSIVNDTLQRTVNGTVQPLVDNVEGMQILYGVDSNNTGTANTYVDAGNLGLPGGGAAFIWDQVVAVRVELLVRSNEDNLLNQAQQYVYDGTTTTAGDLRLRQVFSKTVALRNRLE